MSTSRSEDRTSQNTCSRYAVETPSSAAFNMNSTRCRCDRRALTGYQFQDKDYGHLSKQSKAKKLHPPHRRDETTTRTAFRAYQVDLFALAIRNKLTGENTYPDRRYLRRQCFIKLTAGKNIQILH